MRKAVQKHSRKPAPQSANPLILIGAFSNVQTIISIMLDVATSDMNLAGNTYQVPGETVEYLAGQLDGALAPIRAALLGAEARS